jgi:hypothetical protein
MNKLISVKQSKKNVDLFDDDVDYFDDEEDAYSDMVYDDNLDFTKKAKKSTVQINKNCQNEKCINICIEIEKLNEECNNLEKKCILIDFVKSDQLFEISEKLSSICKVVESMINVVEAYEGESLDNLRYDQLAKIELNLMKLLLKVRGRISKVITFLLN